MDTCNCPNCGTLIDAWALLVQAVNESFDDCTDECTSFGHREGCKTYDGVAMLAALQQRLEATERNEVIVATDEWNRLTGVFFSQADLLTWMRENYHPRKDLRIVREGDNLRVLGKNNWPVTKWLSFRVHRAALAREEPK